MNYYRVGGSAIGVAIRFGILIAVAVVGFLGYVIHANCVCR